MNHHTAPPPDGYVDIEPLPFRAPRLQAKKPRFELEPWSQIVFENSEEWLVKRVLPRRGLAAIYGRPGSLKSFVVSHIALCVALGREWAGRRVHGAPVVYIAAEGASGLRKRKAGYALTCPDLPADVPIYLISAAPNLGADPGDLGTLIADIEAAGVSPGLVILDTLAQTLGSADENGAGMTVFGKNAAALATRFSCLVLAVHHVGLAETAQQRMRGHSSLHGALDVQILCERKDGDLSATLTLQKLKDEASNVQLTVRLSRVVIATDEDGEEISTLVVDRVEDAEIEVKEIKTKPVPQSQRLLMAVLIQALEETGSKATPFGSSGPTVQAVDDEAVRARYYTRIAEQADPDEEADKLASRQRKAFNRSVVEAIKAQRIVAAEIRGRRMLWLP